MMAGSRRTVDVMESAVSSITGSVSNEAEVTMRAPLKVCKITLPHTCLLMSLPIS